MDIFGVRMAFFSLEERECMLALLDAPPRFYRGKNLGEIGAKFDALKTVYTGADDQNIEELGRRTEKMSAVGGPIEILIIESSNSDTARVYREASCFIKARGRLAYAYITAPSDKMGLAELKEILLGRGAAGDSSVR